ncbi:MAG: hypothetical protein HY075_13575 [Deltaproteobacteria bacterium]|nr:hypothetical protein [Deltaproteobacteria bacterium]
MSIISIIGPSAESLIQINSIRLNRTIEQNQYPPAPASALASVVETARAEVNQAALLPAMMAATADGLFTVGATTVKIGSTISAVGNSRSFNSWGF